MSLPSTIEEIQSQVLQGDLSENPYLQPSPIISKDKELKTSAKRIIPAINELLKNLNVLNGTMQGFTDEVQETVEALRVELKAYVDKGIEESVEKNSSDIEALQKLMEEYMNQSLADKVNEMEQSFNSSLDAIQKNYDEKLADMMEQIESIRDNNAGGGTGAGGEEMKRVFHSSMELAKNGTIVAPINLSDIQDVDKQIEVLRFSQAGNVYILDKNQFTLKSSSTSSYQMYTYPINLIVDPTTGTLKLADKAGLDKYIINFYTLE